MRVLQVTSKPMLPSIDGGNRASKALYDHLIKDGCEVDYVTCFSEKHPLNHELYAEEGIALVGSFSVDLQIRLKGSLKALLQNQSYHVARFISSDFSEFIEFHCDEYDVVLFDGLFATTPLLRGTFNHRSKFWLRSHNLEHQIWNDEAQMEHNPLKKRYLKLLAKQLESYENFILQKMKGVLTIREKDILHYHSFGVQSEYLPVLNQPLTRLAPIQPEFYFLGAMNWLPNADTAKRIVSEIFPAIKKNHPEANLHIAGSFMEEIQFSNNHFIQHGFVDDLDSFYQNVSILLAPIETGSGVKIKVLEALQRGKIVLASKKAAEGIDTLLYPNLLLCHSTQDYVHWSNQLLKNDAIQTEIQAKIDGLDHQKNSRLNLKTIFADHESGE